MSDDDRIVFPGEDYDHQDSRPEPSEKDRSSKSMTVIIVVCLLLGTLLLALIVFFIYRSANCDLHKN